MLKVDWYPSDKALRQFAVAALFGFPLMATVFLWWHLKWQPNVWIYLLFALGPASWLLSLVHARALKPLYVGMTLLALPIGFVVANVLLRLIYYGLFTPLALWFRLVGKDTMKRRFEPQAVSYWRDHPGGRTPASYLRLY